MSINNKGNFSVKNIIFSALALSAIPFISTSALANTGAYISGGLGSSFVKAQDLDFHQFEPKQSGYSEIHANFGSTSKAVFSGNFSVGYDFNSNFNIPIRTELAFTTRGNMNKRTSPQDLISSGGGKFAGVMQNIKIRMNTLMVNSYYDIHNSTAFTPYVMAGVGMAFNTFEEFTILPGDSTKYGALSNSKTNLAWALGTGVNYTITDNLSADIGVRYIDAGKMRTRAYNDDAAHSESPKLSSIDMLADIRYTF